MDEQLIAWGGARHARNPKSYPRFCVVTYRGRVSISREEIPADTSITDERRMQLSNVYTMMYRKEVK
jgi:hypothetical protein